MNGSDQQTKGTTKVSLYLTILPNTMASVIQYCNGNDTNA